MTYSKFVAALLLIAALGISGCGGGGGSAGIPSGSSAILEPGSAGGGGTAVLPVVAASAPKLTASVVSQAGASVTGISVGGGFSAQATLVDALGVAVVGKLVTFSLGDATIATLTPTTALTSATGTAKVSLFPASITSSGAATLTASSDFNGSIVTGKVDFSVAASSLTLSSIVAGSSTLASGANTSLAVTALVAGQASKAIPVNVTYSVSCGRINGVTTAGGVSVTTDGSGVASAVFSAVALDGSLCSGVVIVAVSSPNATSQTTTLSVAPATANAITFVSANPAQIFVSGTGAVDQSVAVFKVLSSAGTVLANIPVQFTIATNPGGVGLGAAGSTTQVVGTTDAAGLVSVSLFSGTIPGPVKVRATLTANSAVFSESQNLTVASGPPSQRFMSLAVQTSNIEGWVVDGTSTQLTVRLADRQGNAVADGTVVNFTAEGGQVASSCATSRVLGISQCSVSFVSQNPRVIGGRASVLAYTEGTKDYVDVNGNNRYDEGIDTLVKIGDAYRDDDENGSYQSAAGEFLIPRFGTEACSSAVDLRFPSRANTCDSKLATTVRQQAIILFSSSTPVLDVGPVSTSGFNFRIRSEDNLLLPMPAGTTVTATAIDSNSLDGLTCAVLLPPVSPIPNVDPTTNPLSDISTRNSVGMKDCVKGDGVMMNVTSPTGLRTSFTYRF